MKTITPNQNGNGPFFNSNFHRFLKCSPSFVFLALQHQGESFDGDEIGSVGGGTFLVQAFLHLPEGRLDQGPVRLFDAQDAERQESVHWCWFELSWLEQQSLGRIRTLKSFEVRSSSVHKPLAHSLNSQHSTESTYKIYAQSYKTFRRLLRRTAPSSQWS